MTFRKLWLLSALFVASVFPVIAQESHEGHSHEGQEGDTHEGEEGGEGHADMMEFYMKLAAPGEHHEHMKPLVGKWQAKSKYRMMAEMPWTESTGSADTEWILGGRFLTTKVESEPMMGAPTPFEGFGILGYDNGEKKYISVWMDSMGTLFAFGEGQCDASGKEITIKVEYKDPMSGQMQSMRNVYKVINNDKYVLEMYMTGTDGKEFLGMEIMYTRVAG